MKLKRWTALVLAAVMSALWGCQAAKVASETDSAGNRQLAAAVYPEMAPYPDEMSYMDEKTGEFDQEGFSEAYDQWFSQKRELAQLPEADGKALELFSRNSIRQFLAGTENENLVYSPVNLYLALAMLAETTAGKTRQQILTALGTENMDELRTHAGNIWKLCYCNDGATTSILANSLWLRDGMTYQEAVLKRLAEDYYASVYSGEMGNAEYDKMLQDWLNEQTGGLLKEQAEGIKMSPETVMALASTIYYKAKWQNEFDPEQTKEDTFYGKNETLTCDFMNSSDFAQYFWTETCSAVSLSLGEGGQMWLLLPDEGISPEELFNYEENFEMIFSREMWENERYLRVNLSLPKFDVASELNLRDGLKALGIQEVWDENTADFTPLANPADGIYLSSASHAARVKVDEKGVEAAAYTVMMAAGSAMPPDEEVDFVLNRPFLFVITSSHRLPLFAGVVNQL